MVLNVDPQGDLLLVCRMRKNTRIGRFRGGQQQNRNPFDQDVLSEERLESNGLGNGAIESGDKQKRI